ncbi:MAG: putative endoglucanase precursor, partial [Piptocephalis tieghemiana]
FFRAILFLLLLSGALAGMTMIEPPCRGYPGSLNAPTDEPINRRDPWAAKTYPCQGYGKGPVQRSYRAGMSISTRFSGTSGRGQGGHCQFSLSYDGGKTFIVIRTILGSCLKGADRAYSIRLPKSAPSGDAIFSWTWYNAKGSRDMYQNCADIHIRGSVAGVLTGPRLLIAQLPGTPWIPE